MVNWAEHVAKSGEMNNAYRMLLVILKGRDHLGVVCPRSGASNPIADTTDMFKSRFCTIRELVSGLGFLAPSQLSSLGNSYATGLACFPNCCNAQLNQVIPFEGDLE
jgi:hypothetical protein